MFKRVVRFWAILMVLIVAGSAFVQPVYAEGVSENSLESTENSITDEGEEKLNYIYLENKLISSLGSQSVLVSFGDEDTKIAQGVLRVENSRTGEQLVYHSEETLENTILFEMPFSAEDAGIYEIKAVDIITEAGIETTVRLIDTGIENVCFGVDEEVPESEETGVLSVEAAETDEDLSDVELQIVSLNGEDNQNAGVTADEIGEALANGDAGKMQTEASGNIVVVLDPGHDATHAGTRANGLKEEAITIKIAQYCKAELEEYSGVTVYLTHNGSCPYPGTSSTTCNANRVSYAAGVGANYFVSLHLNYNSSSSVNGSEIYYPNSNYNASIGVDGANLAKNIQRQLQALGLNSRGLKIRNSQDNTKYPDGSLADYYGVIRRSKEAGITGIIVEHAFVSNSSDAAFLSSESNIQKLGVADATGIANYLGLSKEEPVDRAQVEAYVTRLYRLCLGREPEAAGLQYWTDKMCNGETTGADAAYGFFFSLEFENQNHSNEEYVELLYNVMMNRASDTAGKADWIYKLNNGVGRLGVFKGFSDSSEFDAICKSYGIKRGTTTVTEGRDRNPGLTTFVSRLYTKALGRDYDVDGLNTWCNRICDNQWTIAEVSTTGFFSSDEFLNKHLTNSEYVKVLYRTFFDREYDQEGYSDWLSKLNSGVSRKEVLEGFANSQEFANLKKSYGL